MNDAFLHVHTPLLQRVNGMMIVDPCELDRGVKVRGRALQGQTVTTEHQLSLSRDELQDGELQRSGCNTHTHDT